MTERYGLIWGILTGEEKGNLLTEGQKNNVLDLKETNPLIHQTW